MTAATSTTPTEEDIRAELARAWTRRYPVGGSPEFEWDMGWGSVEGMASAPWNVADLRDSELERLDELVSAVVNPIRAEAQRQVIAALVGAMVTFASEHPDAPRAARSTEAA